MKTTFTEEPENLDEDSRQYVEIEGFHVMQWHPLKDGKEKPEQVHMWIDLKGLPGLRFVVRFKGTRSLDGLIAALAIHRREVFGND